MLISNKVAFQLSTQITNKEGRYVLDVMSLLNVYRPPGQDKLLIKKQFNLIATEVSGILICGGGLERTAAPHFRFHKSNEKG